MPREKPYRNAKIISIVQTLYFNGGPSSFASRFRHLFPTSNCLDLDEKKPEVPIPMIALVGTAVCISIHNEFAARLHYLSALCQSTWMAYRWTPSYWVLSKHVPWRLPRAHQYYQVYWGEQSYGIPFHDGWYLYASEVCNLVFYTVCLEDSCPAVRNHCPGVALLWVCPLQSSTWMSLKSESFIRELVSVTSITLVLSRWLICW